MKAADIKKVLELHRKWLNSEVGGACANLSGANLRYANLSGADLSSANLRYANLSDTDLSGANLSSANLRYANLSDTDLSDTDLSSANLSSANLRYANLSDTDLSGADLSSANLSGAKGLLLQSEYIKQNFKTTDSGIIVYKTFSEHYSPNPEWQIEPGKYITETVNPNRTNDCGCGVNVGTPNYVLHFTHGEVWECLIEWPDVAGIVVPYRTDGKIRAERVKLIRIISNEELSKGQDRE